jgi:hypothetical protein
MTLGRRCRTSTFLSLAAKPGVMPAPAAYDVYDVELDDAVGPSLESGTSSLYVGESAVHRESAFVNTWTDTDLPVT